MKNSLVFTIFVFVILVLFFMLKKLMRVVNWVRRHKYLSVTIIFLLIIIVFDDNNFIKHYENQRAISELKKEIEAMQRDSVDIIKKQQQLEYKGDIEAIEHLAREKYGMHKDDEEVFVIK